MINEILKFALSKKNVSAKAEYIRLRGILGNEFQNFTA
jgi:hypothetical protein